MPNEEQGTADGNANTNSTDSAIKPSSGIFAPIWELYDKAQGVHPFVKFVLPALLLIVVAVVMIKYVTPYTGEIGPIRTILYLFFLVFFLMAFFATFADFFVGSTGGTPTNRLPRIILVVIMAAIGLYGAYIVADPQPGNCRWVAVLAGAESAKSCTENPPPIVLNGVIRVIGNPVAEIVGARARVRVFGMKATEPEVLKTGDFEQTLARTDVGKTAEVSVQIPSFSALQTKSAKVGQDGAVVEFVIDPAQLAPTVTVTQSTTAAALVPVRDGQKIAASTTRTGWFDGKERRFDIFYCQAPDGDTVRSKVLAAQLQSVLAQQSGVDGTAIRAWPVSSTPGYGNIQRGMVRINKPVSGSGDALVADLTKLWMPFLPAGVSAGQRPVTSDFPKLTAVVCV
ncbi:hypothetical protein DBR17_03240 [Sphingomonas sp. HMWF008]|nr:hypothetical protein DBR17_03240 [Sphingomonas sp. HMWF008]